MSRKSEDQNPKAERRPKSEGRRVSAPGQFITAANSLRGPVEDSGFGFLSDLGLRISDFRRRPWRWLALLVVMAAAVACRRDMFQQPYSKPLATSDFFRDNQMASRPLVAHTVARGHLEADQIFYTGKIGTN